MEVDCIAVGSVKRTGKRSYDNSERRERSQETRARILDAARQTITAKGYRAATIAEIARAADVHVDTVYELVGRKPALLRALIEGAISGGPDPVAPAQRAYVIAMPRRARPGAQASPLCRGGDDDPHADGAVATRVARRREHRT